MKNNKEDTRLPLTREPVVLDGKNYRSEINNFCYKWHVEEFSLFGSVLRDDFRPDSDVDVLVRLGVKTELSLFDWVEMIRELKLMFGREVDLIEESGLRNPFRRKAILETRRVIYAFQG